MNKSLEEQPKKTKTGPKLNDFHKFRESDLIVSSSGSEESSDEKINNKNDDKKELNKSVENRRNNKNNMFNQYTNYFFDENAINEEKLRNKKNKKMKETKTNVEKIKEKKGFYHYQNNPNKEVKNILDKKFETRTRNPNHIGMKQANTVMENFNTNNNNTKTRKTNPNYKKKKTIVKQFSNNSRKFKTKTNEDNNNDSAYENNLFVQKMKKGRNNINKNDKRLNNTIAYNHDVNLSKENDDTNKTKKQNNTKNIVLKNNITKINKMNSKKKTNKVVQNLIDDFDQTMEEYSSLYNSTSREGRSNKENNDKKQNNKSTSNRKLKSNITNNKQSKKNLNKSIEKSVNRSVLLDNNSNAIRQSSTMKIEDNKSNNSELKKEKTKNKENTKKSKHARNIVSNKDISEFDIGNSERDNSIKNKKSKGNSKYNLKEEEELPLFKGEIDYNNVSIKNISDSVNDLMVRYKKKGYTCFKKGNNNREFTFIKGPNTHHVEIMRLGNGLLYFNITK